MRLSTRKDTYYVKVVTANSHKNEYGPCANVRVRQSKIYRAERRKMPTKYRHCLSIIIDFMIYFYCKTFQLP